MKKGSPRKPATRRRGPESTSRAKATKPAVRTAPGNSTRAVTFQDDLLRFIHTEVLAEESSQQDIDASTPLFEQGLVNSIKILELIAFVEKRLGTKIPDSQIIMKNFRSVQAITDTFARR